MPTDEATTARDELVTALQSLAAEIGRSPTMADLKKASDYPPVSRYLAVFGTWNQAKAAGNLETYQKEGRGVTYSREELISRLQQLAHKTDGKVTKQDVIKAEFCPSAVTYQRHFGSFNAAKKAAGLETIPADETPKRYSDDELCELLQQLAKSLGRAPTICDIDEADGYPDHSTFERRFGSWNQAKAAAGLQTVSKGSGARPDSYSDSALLQLLRERANEIDGVLTKKRMDEVEEYPASSTYQRRFGSWTAAKQKAGLPAFDSPNQYTTDQLVEFLQELAATLDRPITRADVEQSHDLPAVSTFERRFGSWNQAKAAAGLKVFGQGERPSPENDCSARTDSRR